MLRRSETFDLFQPEEMKLSPLDFKVKAEHLTQVPICDMQMAQLKYDIEISSVLGLHGGNFTYTDLTTCTSRE